MYEYRLKFINDSLLIFLNLLKIDVIEEEIYSKKEYVFYSDKNLDSLITSYGLSFSVKNVESLGWEEKWKDFLRPGKLTDNIGYVFDDSDKKNFQKSILINPSLAFGTGNHPTTKIAAHFLEKLSKGKKVLDVGCGSGILSILASIVGAKKVYGFDIDKVALNNTKENIDLNNCSNVFVWAGVINSIKKNKRFDIACANIISSILLDIKNELFNCADKYLIVSGILVEEKEDFLSNFNDERFMIIDTLDRDNWFGAVFKRL